MDNKFFDFVETYKDDIKAFFDALIGAIKAIIEKLSAGDAEATPEA